MSVYTVLTLSTLFDERDINGNHSRGEPKKTSAPRSFGCRDSLYHGASKGFGPHALTFTTRTYKPKEHQSLGIGAIGIGSVNNGLRMLHLTHLESQPNNFGAYN